MSSPSDALRVFITALFAGDAARVVAAMADDCTYAAYPRSLGWPVQSRTQFAELLPMFSKMFLELESTIIDIVESGDKAWGFATVNGKAFDGEPYSNDYVFMTRAVQLDGTWKLLEIKEFVDATAALGMMAKMQAQAA